LGETDGPGVDVLWRERESDALSRDLKSCEQAAARALLGITKESVPLDSGDDVISRARQCRELWEPDVNTWDKMTAS